jgi:hypothetical protein
MRIDSLHPLRYAAVLAALLVVPSLASASSFKAPGVPLKGRPAVIQFTVDVAEDFARFVSTNVNPGDEEPVRGSWFLTEGRIFPGGTIQGDGADFDPSQDGAIGTWQCRGTHLADASEIFDETEPAPLWVVTHQLFLLDSHKRSIATDGVEGWIPVVRAVTGGTGPFRGYVGEQRQQLLGFNVTDGVNLRVTFTLRKAAN